MSNKKTQIKDTTIKVAIISGLFTLSGVLITAAVSLFTYIRQSDTSPILTISPSQVSVRPLQSYPTAIDFTSAGSTAEALSKNADLIFSSDSKMDLKHNNGGIVFALAGVNLSNLIVEAKFDNPYNRDINEWSYGFSFRRQGDATDDFELFDIYVQSDGRWFFNWNKNSLTGESTNPIANGVAKSLDISPSGKNKLKVIAYNKTGYFYVNDELIALLDISSSLQPGDVAIVTGFKENQTLLGASTIVEELKIWSLKP